MSTTTVEHSTAELSSSFNRRDQLLRNLHGQTAQIPDLKPIFADWKGINQQDVSPWVEPLRKRVEERIRRLGFNEEKTKRLKKADFGLFTALWWPEPSLERLEILAYLVVWLFTWDDEIDEPTGAYSESFSGAQTYRDQTLQFVEECMGLAEDSGHGGPLRPQSHVVQSFDVIGLALRASYDQSQLRRFRDEIARFMKASEVEQRVRLRGEIPTIEEYWDFRMGTSAVYIGSAAGEYSMAAHLPLQVMESDAMRALWDENNIIISITNDLLSLRKEIRLGCLDSIVPLTFVSTNDLCEAISRTISALAASKERHDEAARKLLAGTEVKNALFAQIGAFVQVQRSNCVGNLVWSLETQRYDVAGVTKEDQSLEFTL